MDDFGYSKRANSPYNTSNWNNAGKVGLLAVIADFERVKIRERQAEGIAIAKAKGK
ncbi:MULTISPECIES: recombinase family protein [Auritidibacter]|uniref:recombinase family protein n=1 Tax=Auritidibacter TaxID=1160973 RepID=UPI000D726C09|nr:hypothetical protein DCC24_06165 [Auritidibacter sp. NML100628]PXA79986.1 hypothetical protein DCC26_04615 [Auritidibacter sp. NML120779]RMX23125.1 hypothetical protein DYI20_06210 [Auritidibacter ignavus]